jgi:hypothetical protein
VTVGGTSYTSSQTMILVYQPTGTYSFTVANIAGFVPQPHRGTVHLASHDHVVHIVFT